MTNFLSDCVGTIDCSEKKGGEAAFTTWTSMRVRVDA
jgi:hypothetical protein